MKFLSFFLLVCYIRNCFEYPRRARDQRIRIHYILSQIHPKVKVFLPNSQKKMLNSQNLTYFNIFGFCREKTVRTLSFPKNLDKYSFLCYTKTNFVAIGKGLIVISLSEILAEFSIDLPAKPFGNGHINSTFAVGEPVRFVLQKINTTVFTDPEGLMENVLAVTGHLRGKILAAGGDPDRETLTYLPTRDGKSFFQDAEGNCWRVYQFIGDAESFESATPALFAESARAFGKFQEMLSDFPAETLHETIPHFHDTAARLKQLKTAIAEDRFHRADAVRNEISFALSRAGDTAVITDGIRDGSIPLHVTHNDTKLNNVLFDAQTSAALCVIDLDTVMPGSLLYDFGDALRFGASTAAEDETDLSLVHFDLALFSAYTDAYLSVLAGKITPREVELLPTAARIITLETGMRFLADHLNGDVYFRIHREGQNLDRARTQFRLVEDMEEKSGELDRILSELRNKYGV